MLKIEKGKNNPILRKIAEKIHEKDYKDTINLGKEMVKFLKNRDNGSIGLAAPQIGKSIRLIAVGLPKTWEDETYKITFMINPEILEHSNEKEYDTEGCLSLPKKRANVGRFRKIRLQYIDDEKKTKVLILEGLQARIVQHEVDHLNGILFTDYIEENEE